MNRLRVRLLFYAHVIVASYCLVCGLLDGMGLFHDWMIPNIIVFYGLFWSAVLLPISAGLSLIGSGVPRPFWLLSVHIGMGVVQLFLGLFPLVS